MFSPAIAQHFEVTSITEGKDRLSGFQQFVETGEAPLEILVQSRFLLYKHEGDRTSKQSQRAQTLFNKHSEIQRSYELCCEFRSGYKKANIGKSKSKLIVRLNQWYQRVLDIDIEEVVNSRNSVMPHQLAITETFLRVTPTLRPKISTDK